MPYRPVSKAGQAIGLLLPLIDQAWPKPPPMVKALFLQKDKLLQWIDTDPAVKDVMEQWIDRLSKAQIL